ncbi:MAG: GGDEF domain-containing protein [Xanthomonadales bacterium]|nr:GGDEF domain-containing protein [Xanthomonadales bacterium]
MAVAKTVGRPPITEIEVPSEPYITYFDMAQDHNNVIYLSYEKGIKIFDGYNWQTLLIPDTILTRVLYFDGVERVYVGGFDFFGYISRNQYGQYEFIDLTPQEDFVAFASIWDIISCNQHIYFKALNHIFELNPDTGNINSWSFEHRLGGILCQDSRLLLQDRTEGMKQLQDEQWVESLIHLDDNSLVYQFDPINKDQVFIRSLTDNWRIIENEAVKPITFDIPLPELGSYATSLPISNNKLLLGGKDGELIFLDFTTGKAETFQISSDWIAAIIVAKDGGLLILSNFKIFHLTWPSPWRIQDSKTGLSSDIFDLATWNNQLYVTSRSGVFVEQSMQPNGYSNTFQRLNWTPQEAWNLMPLNDEEILLADSHYISLIKNNEKTILSDVIYPRVFQKSKFHDQQYITYTELDTRILVNDQNSWSDWVVATGKPNGVTELSEDTLLIATVSGEFIKVNYNNQNKSVEATVDLTQQDELLDQDISELLLFEGPNNQTIAVTPNNYYLWENEKLKEANLWGLADVLSPQDLSSLGMAPNRQLWAISATKLFLMQAPNNWLEIDGTPYVQGGLYDIEFVDNQIKLSANSVILSYLPDEMSAKSKPSGTLMITSAKLSPKNKPGHINLPIKNPTPLVIDKGSLTFQYAFTDLKNSGQTRYQYRLAGHNSDWSPLSHNTEASFLELPAGNYEFQVKAIDVHGSAHLSEPLAFVIEPVWYQTQWAQLIWTLGSILLLIFLLSAYLRWREKRHEIQKQALKQTINEKTLALKMANQALQELAHKDSLTGLSNRLFLDKYINQLIKTKASSIAVLMLDIDHFKQYNDTHGHLAGDQLLEQFAQSLSASVTRKVDLVARYGGEEFLVILPDVHQQYAQTVAETIRQNTHQKNNISVSVGVILSKNNEPITDAKEVFNLIDDADKALYHAKASGRNRVVMFDELATEEN